MRPRVAVAALIVAVAFATGCGARPKLHRVEIRSFRFEPAVLTVARGDTVEWANRDIVPHTATSPPTFDSGSIAIQASWRWVASGPGAHEYRCTFHPTMTGTLTVR